MPPPNLGHDYRGFRVHIYTHAKPPFSWTAYSPEGEAIGAGWARSRAGCRGKAHRHIDEYLKWQALKESTK